MFSKNKVLKSKKASKIDFHPLEKNVSRYVKQNYKHVFSEQHPQLQAMRFPTIQSFFFFAIFLLVLTWLSNNFYFYTITEVHFSGFPKPPYSTSPICHHLLPFSVYFLCDRINTWKITNVQMTICRYIWGLGIIKVNCQNALNTFNFVGSCMWAAFDFQTVLQLESWSGTANSRAKLRLNN